MTKTIELTQGKVALVDDEDYERINAYKWYYCKGYAVRKFGSPPRKFVYMHRVILDTPDGLETDHVNGDGVDNRKANLRACTRSENQRNLGRTISNTSGFKGVTKSKGSTKWIASIKHFGQQIYLGRFTTPEAAARAYDEAALKLHGEFARTNEAIS